MFLLSSCLFQAYESYSFEELRFASPTPKRWVSSYKNTSNILLRNSLIIDSSRYRPSENMLIRANTDGTYSANWTPGAVGLYTIHVTIDGIEIGRFSQHACFALGVQCCLNVRRISLLAGLIFSLWRCWFGGRSQRPSKRYDTSWNSYGQTKDWASA